MNCSVAETAVSPAAGTVRSVTAPGGWDVDETEFSILASTRPLSPLLLSLITSSRPSPEPGLPVEMVASRGLMTPVVPVQSP